MRAITDVDRGLCVAPSGVDNDQARGEIVSRMGQSPSSTTASNALTDFMMTPYLDQASGELVDPSDPVGWSPHGFADYVCCLKEQLSVEEFESLRAELTREYEALLSAPQRSDVLVVPADSLFVEALPAERGNIELYKQIHRKADVKDAQAVVCEKELKNTLRAARLLAGERDGPDIDEKVVIDGQPSVVISPPH